MVDDDFILDSELEEEIEAARNAGVEATRSGHRAQEAWYDSAHHTIMFKKTDGVVIGIPINLLQGLGNATRAELSEVEVTPSGYGLHWESLDIDLAVPQLMRQVFGTKTWMSKLGLQDRQSRTPTKRIQDIARKRRQETATNTANGKLVRRGYLSYWVSKANKRKIRLCRKSDSNMQL